MAVLALSGDGKIAPLLLAASGFFLLYVLFNRVSGYFRRRRISRDNGCEPIPRWPNYDRILGTDVLREVLADAKARRSLEGFLARFRRLGVNTFRMGAAGKLDVFTIEPENLKTVQSLRFKDYSLGRGRSAHIAPCLGPGIFTNNGADWQHSREMLRPNFARDRVRDLDSIEVHIHHLIDAIPTDGSTVDLSDLFFRLTMDSSTEFLFGESTGTLLPGTEKASGADFALAFNRAQEFMSWLIRYGIFSWFLSRGQFRKDTKVIHGELSRLHPPRAIERN